MLAHRSATRSDALGWSGQANERKGMSIKFESAQQTTIEDVSLTMSSLEQEILSARTRLYDCFPGGNDTFLVLNESLQREVYPRVNQVILGRYPQFEQGAVLERSANNGVLRMQMTGGEFCGNATRSAAALIAETFTNGVSLASVADYSLIQRDGSLLTFSLEVSGADNLVSARVSRDKQGWDVEIGLPRMAGRDVAFGVPLTLAGERVECTVVSLEGISHILIPDSEVPFKNDQERFQLMVADAISQLEWANKAAFGLIWVKEGGDKVAIEPVVYVKSLQTCIYESACGSGTIAVALAATPDGESRVMSVQQPSGAVLTAKIDQADSKGGIGATLRGPVEIRGDLNEGAAENAA